MIDFPKTLKYHDGVELTLEDAYAFLNFDSTKNKPLMLQKLLIRSNQKYFDHSPFYQDDNHAFVNLKNNKPNHIHNLIKEKYTSEFLNWVAPVYSCLL